MTKTEVASTIASMRVIATEMFQAANIVAKFNGELGTICNPVWLKDRSASIDRMAEQMLSLIGDEEAKPK